MTHIITRRLEFDAAHRVLGHESKCKHLHGHRYIADISFTAGLDGLGRVIDFGVIKEVIGGWIDTHWDHNIILHPDDPLLDRQIMKTPKNFLSKFAEAVFAGKMPYVMPANSNPTAENMAKHLYQIAAADLISKHITITQVRIWETPNCYANYIP